MNFKLLQLNLAQLTSTWNKSRNNTYSDSFRQDYHNTLEELFKEIDKEDFSKLDANQLEERSFIIQFFFDSVTFLDNSTLSNIPFEIVKCLELALKTWYPKNDNDFIIVTSLIKNIKGFSFNPILSFYQLYYDIIEKNYGIKFKKKLIQINVPEYLVNDYLASVPLYHELGHFIDKYYNFSVILANDFSTDIHKLISDKDFVEFFPLLQTVRPNELKSDQVKRYLENQIAEYFCDIFASQYISDSLTIYLSFLAHKANSSPTHPSTENRQIVIENFLNNEHNFVISKLRETVLNCTKNSLNLEIRFRKFKNEDFKLLIPQEINSEAELHYLFKYGWDMWQSDWSDLSRSNNMTENLTSYEVYTIINNLIEKAIGNYIVQNTWNKL
ncbi:MAG: hypothetical protein DSY77_12840 [Bacteroidetes bacterium]|nr:MAG: hypothetical protein DSY77_12840 [Bacteroidota bacterium]